MKKFYLFAALAAGMTFASCTNDENVDVVDKHGANLMVENVGLEGMKSRAGITAGSFTNGESLGVFVFRGAAGTYTDYNDDDDALPTENINYTQSDAGWRATQPIVMSTVKGVVYAYYPYADNQEADAIATNVKAAQGTGQSDGSKDQDQTDYMYATPVSNKSNADNSVDLTMNHALAMVTFQFKQTTDNTLTYPGEGKVSSIVLKNKDGKSAIMIGDATMNIADGAITGGTPATAGITLTPNADETLMDVVDAAKLPRLLLYPAAVAADDAEVTITVDGNPYTLNIPALDYGYQPGKNYVYTFTLKGTGLTISNVSINPWDNEVGGSGDIQKPDNHV